MTKQETLKYVLANVPDDTLMTAAEHLSDSIAYIEEYGFDIGRYGHDSTRACYMGTVRTKVAKEKKHWREEPCTAASAIALRLLDDVAININPDLLQNTYLGGTAEDLGFVEKCADFEKNAQRALEVFKMAIVPIYDELDRRRVQLTLEEKVNA